jgi:hypothetical protein
MYPISFQSATRLEHARDRAAFVQAREPVSSCRTSASAPGAARNTAKWRDAGRTTLKPGIGRMRVGL